MEEVGVQAVVKGLKNFNKGIDQMNKKTGLFQKTVSGLGKVAKPAFGILAGVGTAALLGGAKAAADFDKNMREVNTLLGLSEDEFKEFKDEVRDLSSEMGVAADEVVPALYQAISAGIPRENVLEFMRVASEAAIGGVTETEVAVDGLTTVINAFGMEASDARDVADVMFTAVKAGKTTFDELSASLYQAAPLAASMGVSFEEVAAAATTLTKQGTPTSVAMTQIRAALVALQKPTGEMQELLGKLGYETGTAAIEALGLQGTLNALRTQTGATDEQLTKAFGSVEALGFVLGTTGDKAEGAAADLEMMENATGASTAAFEEMDKTATRTWDKLRTKVINTSAAFAEKFGPALQVVAIGMGKFGPLIGGATTAMLAMKTTLLTSLIPALKGLMSLALTPVGIAITGLIAIGVLLITHWDDAKRIAIEVFGTIKDFIVNTFNTIKEFLEDHWKWFALAASAIFGPVGILAVAMVTNVGGFRDKFMEIMDEVVEFFEGIGEKFVTAWETVETFFTETIPNAVTGAFSTLWETVGNSFIKVKDFFVTAWNEVRKFFTDTVWGSLTDIFRILWNVIGNSFIKVKDFFVTAWEEVKKFFTHTIWDTITGIFGALWHTVGNGFENVKTFFQNAWENYIKPFFRDTVWGSLVDIFSNIWDAVANTFKIVVNGIITAINTIISGLNTAINALDVAAGPFVNFPEIPKIPYWGRMQYGGIVQKGGLFEVGEAGPELVHLPIGASVTPLTQNFNYNVEANYSNPETPQGISYDLQSIIMMARS